MKIYYLIKLLLKRKGENVLRIYICITRPQITRYLRTVRNILSRSVYFSLKLIFALVVFVSFLGLFFLVRQGRWINIYGYNILVSEKNIFLFISHSINNILLQQINSRIL